MNKLFLIIPLLLIGCSPKTTIVPCPDGDRCASVDCSNNSLSHSDCVVAFGTACPHGYDILEDKDGSYLIKCHSKPF